MNKKDFTAFIATLKSTISIPYSDTIFLHGCQIHPMTELSNKEQLIIKNSVASRQHEFSAGRYCARQCLSHYGTYTGELLKHPLGNPIWPKGFTGSITHHDHIALAVVSPITEFMAIGIDLTSSAEHLEDSNLLMSKREIRLISELTAINNTELLIFCIKEAAIKICSPLLKEYIDFCDLTLHKDHHNDLFIRHPSINNNIRIIWHESHGWLFSLASLT
jgi:4'-phosphopantetheinyl transferase EntD